MADDASSPAADIADLDARITEQEAQIDELRQQIGGQDGPQDPEDTAAALTNIQELEGALAALATADAALAQPAPGCARVREQPGLVDSVQ